MKLVSVDLPDTAETDELRIDPHHYSLRERVLSVFSNCTHQIPPYEPLLRFENGHNLAQNNYAEYGSALGDFVYVSVGALSSYALQLDRTIPLRDPLSDKDREELCRLRSILGEVLITRSGTPGIPWAVTPPADGPSVIASGFVIRAHLDTNRVMPEYFAAVLSHPVWRLYSASLASGKRQRNLSQEHLRAIPVPDIPMPSQVEIAERYRSSQSRLLDAMAQVPSLKEQADKILATFDSTLLRLSVPSWAVNRVRMTDVGESRLLRADSRYHRRAYADVLGPLSAMECVMLKDLLAGPIRKGVGLTASDDSSAGQMRVVATVSIQAGQAVEAALKWAEADHIKEDDDRILRNLDLLMTMDGAASIGRTALFTHEPGNDQSVPDSHVAIVRVAEPKLASALLCFLNSSAGQAQIERSISGALAPQLSVADLEELLVPKFVVDNMVAIGSQFSQLLSRFATTNELVRGIICELGATTTELLVPWISDKMAADLVQLSSIETLHDLLGELTPDMF